MTTLQITLDDDTVVRVQRAAEAEQISVEAFIASAAAERADRVDGVSADFRDLAADLVEKYKPLLDRLA